MKFSTLIIKLTHTGSYADGSPHGAPVYINDLDEGHVQQNRKVTVYVSPNTPAEIPLTSRSLFSLSQGAIKGFVNDGLITAEIIYRIRKIGDFGGATGQGVMLAPIAQNAERSGGIAKVVLNAGDDAIGFLAGEKVNLSGLGGGFGSLNGEAVILNIFPEEDLSGMNASTYSFTFLSEGPDIAPGDAVTGTENISLPDSKITVEFSGEGGVGGSASDFFGYIGGTFYPDNGGGAAVSAINVWDEGVPLSSGPFDTLNFIGSDVYAFPSGVGSVANIYVPSPPFASHWNTSDGVNGAQIVAESITRTSVRISTPFGGEGSPFKTNGWAGTNQDATDTGTVSFTTPAATTGFGGDSTMEVTVFDADGSTVLDSFTTPAVTSNNIFFSPSGFITVTVSDYAADTLRFRARINVSVDADGVLSNAGLDGGRYHVRIDHNTDSSTDGTGPYTYTQADLFYDTDPTTPEINGAVSLGETAGFVVTKHLSGLEYYELGSRFTVSATTIDDLNENTQPLADSLLIDGSKLALPVLGQSPFGTGSGNFSGWTNNSNQDNVDYSNTALEISTSSFRYIGPTANVSATPQDSWGAGSTADSPNLTFLIDTYPSSSEDRVENFEDEDRRQTLSFNGGSFTGNWNSTFPLSAGEAIVFGGELQVPNQTTFIRSDGPNSPNANWAGYQPSVGGPNFDYSALGAPASYYRTWRDSLVDGGPLTGLSRASGQLVFSGTFVTSATSDLAAGEFEIFFYKVAGVGNSGPPPGNTTPLSLHGAAYNFATFDDGVTDGHIRESSSSGDTVNFTFGGFPCEDGLYMQIRIVNPVVKISGMQIIFF